jgi:hypothetical protein
MAADSGRSSSFSYDVNFAFGAAGNPVAVNARLFRNPSGLGPRRNEKTSDTYLFLG